MSIADNVKWIRDRIADAAIQSGRRPSDITLVAASKMNGAPRVREAILAGVDAVGENRVQELLAKDEKGAYAGAPLHFIGHLQSNKVKPLVARCQLIESVDSAQLLREIDHRAAEMGKVQDVLIEVNIGGEASKSGVSPENLKEILEIAPQFSSVQIEGLMCIPPISEKIGGERPFFDRMYELFVDIKEKKYDNISMQHLSMGMSSSFEDAILSGATMVRVGTAIFGDRQ